MGNSEILVWEPPTSQSHSATDGQSVFVWSPILAPWSLFTVTHLPGDLDHMFQLPYGSKCSGPPMICHIQAPKQRQSWLHSVLCGQACRRIAAPGHVLASPASIPKSPTAQSLHWATYFVLQMTGVCMNDVKVPWNLCMCTILWNYINILYYFYWELHYYFGLEIILFSYV
jgi:hypothetical protein